MAQTLSSREQQGGAIRHPTLVGFLLGAAATLIVANRTLTDTFKAFELKAYDRLLRCSPPIPESDRIVFVDIDDASIDAIGEFPFPRHNYAKVVDLLTEAGAAQIVLDIEFPDGLAHRDEVGLDHRHSRAVAPLRRHHGRDRRQQLIEPQTSANTLNGLCSGTINGKREDVDSRRTHEEVGQLGGHQHAVRHEVTADPPLGGHAQHLRYIRIEKRLTEAADPVLDRPGCALL